MMGTYNPRTGERFPDDPPAANVAEAMARLRHVCAGEPAGDALPPPPPPPYLPVVDPFRRNPIGSPNCDHVMPRPWRWPEMLEVAIPFGLMVLALVLAAGGALWFGPN